MCGVHLCCTRRRRSEHPGGPFPADSDIRSHTHTHVHKHKLLSFHIPSSSKKGSMGSNPQCDVALLGTCMNEGEGKYVCVYGLVMGLHACGYCVCVCERARG